MGVKFGRTLGRSRAKLKKITGKGAGDRENSKKKPSSPSKKNGEQLTVRFALPDDNKPKTVEHYDPPAEPTTEYHDSAPENAKKSKGGVYIPYVTPVLIEEEEDTETDDSSGDDPVSPRATVIPPGSPPRNQGMNMISIEIVDGDYNAPAVVSPDKESDDNDQDTNVFDSIYDSWSKVVTILTTSAPTNHMDAVRDLFTTPQKEDEAGVSDKPIERTQVEAEGFNNDALFTTKMASSTDTDGISSVRYAKPTQSLSATAQKNRDSSAPFDEDPEGENDELSTTHQTSPKRSVMFRAFDCGGEYYQGNKGGGERKGILKGILKNASTCGNIGLVGSNLDDDIWSYEEKFTLEWMTDATKNGITLMWHQPPTEPDSDADWAQCRAKIFIIPGNFRGSHLISPRLSWATNKISVYQQPESGGDQRVSSNTLWTSIELLSIHSILGGPDTDENKDKDVTREDAAVESFFSITTNEGSVYVFEASSPKERDSIVHGLKNVVAKLSYHLVLGDIAVSTSLYGDDPGHTIDDGQLPSLSTPEQAMNEITHAFLDG